MPVSPVPSKAAYYTAAQYWHTNAHNYINASGVGTYSGTTGIQYDSAAGKYFLKDYTGDAATWDPKITRAWQEYNYYVNTIAVPAGAIATYLMHLDGFYRDYQASVTRSPTSVTNINNILTQATYMVTDGGDDMTKQEFSREVAYVLMAHLIAPLVGITLSGAQVTRRDTMYTRALGHLSIWANNTGTYCRPFMATLTCKSLIKYHELIATAPQKATILAAIQSIVAYLDSATWKASAGTWGAGQSFLYTDRFVVDADDLKTAPDLNAIISPVYAWLWYQTGIQSYRTRHDDIFEGGIPVYDGFGSWVSGAYQGSAAGPALKQISQQTYWAPQGITWAESTPLSGGSFNLMSTIACTRQSSENNNVTPVKVTFAAINTDYTIGVPSSSTKRIVVCGAIYQSSLAHTLTFKSNTTTLATLQRTTYDGMLKPLDAAAIVVGEPGETVTIRTDVVIGDILFYYYECTKFSW